jgi:hypothetical protein
MVPLFTPGELNRSAQQFADGEPSHTSAQDVFDSVARQQEATNTAGTQADHFTPSMEHQQQLADANQNTRANPEAPIDGTQAEKAPVTPPEAVQIGALATSGADISAILNPDLNEQPVDQQPAAPQDYSDITSRLG